MKKQKAVPETHKVLSGSGIDHFSNWDQSKKTKSKAKDRIRVKLIMRANAEDHPDISRHLSFAERHTIFSDHTGVEEHHIEVIRKFAKSYRLDIDKINAGLGIVNLSGTIAAMEKAFKVELYTHAVELERKMQVHTVTGHTGEASVPEELLGIVKSVIGLNNTIVHHQLPEPLTPMSYAISAASGLSADWFAKHYHFPEKYDGSGQQIAIISCGGGFKDADFIKYFKMIGIKNPPVIETVSVDGTQNAPGINQAADYELYTDCLVAATAAPGATIRVYFVRNDVMGFADAIEMIASEGENSPHIISYSWGASETTYSKSTIDGVNQILQYATQVNQISIFCSTGDFGSTNAMQNVIKTPLAVQFPASSPWVTSCGGTMFLKNKVGRFTKEVVWNSTYLYDVLITNASGGGFSVVNKRPDYQKRAIPGKAYPRKFAHGRGIPDVAGHANVTPNSIAYWILLNDANWLTGGTSAVAPFWAALTARLNHGLNKRIGFFNPILYDMAGTQALQDITEGNNIMPKGPQFWEAKSGWDPCTGLGIPHGERMLKWLKKNFK